MIRPARSNGQRLARIVIGMLVGIIVGWFVLWGLFGLLLSLSVAPR